jgi:hypothetical protein
MHCTGKHCSRSASIKEFYGFCETCWIKLSPGERAALKGTELPRVDVVVTKENALTLGGVLNFFWKVGITAAVGYLFYKNGLLPV